MTYLGLPYVKLMNGLGLHLWLKVRVLVAAFQALVHFLALEENKNTLLCLKTSLL